LQVIKNLNVDWTERYTNTTKRTPDQAQFPFLFVLFYVLLSQNLWWENALEQSQPSLVCKSC